MLFFFNDTATTEIYTLSLHDALPISATVFIDGSSPRRKMTTSRGGCFASLIDSSTSADRKSTRLNSSHANISYAVFCLTKKNHKFGTTSNLAEAEHGLSLLPKNVSGA